jgi:hypothetical protein
MLTLKNQTGYNLHVSCKTFPLQMATVFLFLSRKHGSDESVVIFIDKSGRIYFIHVPMYICISIFTAYNPVLRQRRFHAAKGLL